MDVSPEQESEQQVNDAEHLWTAAAELLRATEPGARVVTSGYTFPTVKGRGEHVARPPRPPAALAAVLGDLVALVRAATRSCAPT